MTNNSTYTRYLPPVLWTAKNDPNRLLGRSLRIFERLLTGLPLRSQVVRVSAPMVSAAANAIVLGSPDDAAQFRKGDTVTIVGTAERGVIDAVVGPDLMLTAPLTLGPYGAGVARIADLAIGQTTFRLDSTALLGAESPIAITQGPHRETARVRAVDDELVEVAAGLTRDYPLTTSHMPVVITDGTKVELGGESLRDYEETIDDIYTLMSPWLTPASNKPPGQRWVDWLASWVGLELREFWTEYQKRHLISTMVPIYQQRGLKRGLYTYLDIYTNVGDARPRIAIDDGEALVRVDVSPERALLHEIAHAQTITLDPASPTPTVSSPLLAPTDVAMDSSNTYFVTDFADDSLAEPRDPALWQMSSTGELPYAAAPEPLPEPVHIGAPFARPRATVVDGSDRVTVLDMGSPGGPFVPTSAIYRFTPPGYALSIVVDQALSPSWAVSAVDLVIDGSGQLVVLDRGIHALGEPPFGPSAPKLVEVSEGPLTVTPHALASVTEPTAMVMDTAGRFIIADAQDQSTTTPAELVRVDPAAGWAETALLAAVANNPLVFPVGLAWESDDVLLVLDSGVRWGFVTTVTNRVMAEGPALYRIDLAPPVPTVTRIPMERRFARPMSLRTDRDGRLVVVEQGEVLRSVPSRNWRAHPNEFGVDVLFSNQRPTSVDKRNQILRSVGDLIEEHKVAHTQWWIDF